MTVCKYIRFFFGLILLNFLIFLALWSCYNYYKNDHFFSLFLICLVGLSAINFLSFCLLAKLKDNKNKLKKLEADFSDKIKECFEKIADSYNLIEASRISLGVYHDLANILTTSSLLLNEVSENIGNNSKIEGLIKRFIYINNRAVNLLKSFKKQCQKGGEKKIFSLSEEIKRSLIILNFYFIKNNIELELKIRDNIKISGDSIKFSQIVTNLISNAIESFPKNNKDKKIIVILEKKEDKIELIIKDNGVGISSANLKKIFDPFFSSKNSSETQHCGIGLSLVKTAVEVDFKGEISVSSILGEGTKFRLLFPIS
ncbi:MAG: HAMP domain-containing sensor histidine kinase [Patescibacteria group bacterium]|jgi:signal transduction histidine kinase